MNVSAARRGVVTALAAVVAATGVVAVLTPSPAAASSPCGSKGGDTGTSCVYSAVGTDTFTVPEGVDEIRITAYGASSLDVGGGKTVATFDVSTGQVLRVNVGGRGTADSGGFNGGGAPGATQDFPLSLVATGYGGSGASDVRTGSYGLTDRIIVAGGAGGGIFTGPDGGLGGGDSGTNGGTGDRVGSGGGGGAGNQLGGGPSPGRAGSAGFGFGGSGGFAVLDYLQPGAGGGGGWYGGGGGDGANFEQARGGGGGGGSGHVSAAGRHIESVVGGQEELPYDREALGRGEVRIRYQAPTASVRLTADQTSPIAEGTPITFRTVVTTSTGEQPQGTIVITDGNRNVAQGGLQPNTDGDMEFVFTKNSSSLTTGSHSFVAHYDDAHGEIASASSPPLDFTVGPQSQTVVFTSAPPGPALVGDDYEVSAYASSGLPVTLTTDPTPDVCSLSGSTVTFITAGTCTIQAIQFGNDDYSIAIATQDVTVTQLLGQTITFTSAAPTDAVYGGSYSPTATGGGSGNLVTFSSATTSVCTVSDGTVSLVGVGDCTVEADQAAASGYKAAATETETFAVGKAALTVTASSDQMTYGGTVPTITPTYSPLSNGDTADAIAGVECAADVTSTTPAGTYPKASSCSGGSAAHYTLSYVDGTVTIAPATITVTPAPATAPYGTVPEVAPTYSPFRNGQTSAVVSGTTCSANTTTTTLPDTYADGSSCAGATADNYTFEYAPGTVTITKADAQLTTSSSSLLKSLLTGRMTFVTRATNAASGAPVVGVPVTVTVPINRHPVTCTATTNEAGVATCTSRNPWLLFLVLRFRSEYAASAGAGPAYNAARTHGVIRYL